MLINFNKINFILPLIKFQLFSINYCIYLKSYILPNILSILKYHFKYQFKILTCISAVDYIINKNRFIIVYEILALKFNNRLRLKTVVNEIIPIYSIKNIFIGAVWWEDEIWDLFGILFLKRKNLVRLLTDYGFQGFPMRKDFPLSGFIDIKYNLIKNKILYNNLEFSQNYRIFIYNSPWF